MRSGEKESTHAQKSIEERSQSDGGRLVEQKKKISRSNACHHSDKKCCCFHTSEIEWIFV